MLLINIFKVHPELKNLLLKKISHLKKLINKLKNNNSLIKFCKSLIIKLNKKIVNYKRNLPKRKKRFKIYCKK